MDEPIVVVVDNRVRLPRVFDEELEERICDLFTHANPNKQDEEGPVFYRTWKREGDELSVPRGGLSRIRTILNDNEIPFILSDERETGNRKYLDNDWDGRPIPPLELVLRAWQAKAADALIAKQNCILRAPTASGKTTCGLYIYTRMNLSTLVIVPTTGLIQQWVERLDEQLKIHPKDIGIIGDGKHRTAPITVATQAALAVGIRPEWKKAFGALIYDEVQRAAAPTCFAAVDPWPAKFRLGMSADESRHDKKEFLIYDLFGDVAADIKREDILAAKQMVDVEIVMVPTEFKADWYKNAVISNNRFYLRAAHRKLLEVMWKDEDRNDIVLKIVSKEVKAGNQIMVLSQRREHCMQLDQTFTKMRMRSGIMLGGQKARKQFNITKDGIRDGSIRVISGTYDAIGTGQDFPSLYAGFGTMPIANNKQLVNQVKGRFARACEEIGKTKGRFYYAYDIHIFGRRPLENMLKWKHNVSVLEGDVFVPGEEYLERLGGIMGKKRPNFAQATLDDIVGGSR